MRLLGVCGRRPIPSMYLVSSSLGGSILQTRRAHFPPPGALRDLIWADPSGLRRG